MRLESLYRARFSTPQSWSVELTGPDGTEGQNFLLTEGRCEGRVAASWHGANYPRRRTDGILTPDFRGVLETDDGATILFAWHGYGRANAEGTSQLVGSMTHITDDERYRWLNDAFSAAEGEVRHWRQGNGVDVVLEVSELVWEPPAD
jgi:Protein of unknown function (DUF3237)